MFWNRGKFSNTGLVLDTFYVKYCSVIAKYYKIDHNLALSFLSEYKNCITSSYLYANKNACLRFFEKYKFQYYDDNKKWTLILEYVSKILLHIIFMWFYEIKNVISNLLKKSAEIDLA